MQLAVCTGSSEHQESVVVYTASTEAWDQTDWGYQVSMLTSAFLQHKTKMPSEQKVRIYVHFENRACQDKLMYLAPKLCSVKTKTAWWKLFNLLLMLSGMTISPVVTERIPSQTEACIDTLFGSAWGCKVWNLTGVALFSYRPQLSCEYWLSYGNLNSTGLKILAARWVDLGYRLWRACLHSLTDVITSYHRGISKFPVMTLVFISLWLHGHRIAADWQGAWPRSSAEESHSCVFYDRISVCR